MRVSSVGITDVYAPATATIIEPSNIYGATLGEYTFVGPFCEIQRGVTIGSYTKIQSHTFICELVTIGHHCFIAHGVMFVNDTFTTGAPARGDVKLWRSTHIHDNISIGSNSTILPVTICNNVVIGAGSVVTKDIAKPGIYAGNPARLLRQLP